MEHRPVRVLIVDDQALLRQGLSTLLGLEERLQVVGTAVDGTDAIAQTRELRPDVVLMDLRMPGMDGVTATRIINQQLPPTRVLVLTTFDDDESIIAALRAGAGGYVLKDTPSEELARDILAVAAGEASLSPSVARQVIAEMLGRATEPGPPAATERIDLEGRERPSERELDVLRLAAQGLNNRQIGQRLSITEGTVKNHVSSLLAKLQMRDRTQAVVFVKEQGWI